jgi:squalene synthase HpnC
LEAVYAGRPRHPVTVALQDTVRRFAIPPSPFHRLLDAFEQDQRVRRYDTFTQLVGYCERSANPVGELVLYLYGVRTPERVTLSDHVCTGLQLANFWQDVARDLDIGRVYLPREDRERFGYPDQDLLARRFTPQFAELMRFQADRTRQLFDKGEPLIGSLPWRVRPVIAPFAAGGRAVLDAIGRQGYDVWTRRPVVPGRRKAAILLRSLLTCLRP